LLWGPDIFLALYDDPALVHALLDLVVRTYIAWLTLWKEQLGEGNDFTAHWSILMRGGAMLRDDTPVMLSRAQYEAFVKPYDQRVLDAFGGCIHFCGRGDHWISSMTTSRNLYGVNLSQPDWNNMAAVWGATRERHIVVLDLRQEYLPPGTRTGVTLRR
jgi:uroporphyrinogen-III decarboxylase